MPGLFDVLLEMHPDVIEIRLYYASYLTALEQFDDAVKQYEFILDNIDSKNVQSWGGIIDIKLQQNNPEDLANVTNKAILNLPEYPQWYLYQSIAYTQLKRNDDAINSLEKGLPLIMIQAFSFV